jgi:hypothetical protein
VKSQTKSTSRDSPFLRSCSVASSIRQVVQEVTTSSREY